MKLAIKVDAAELAVRMCEASYGLVRPMPSAQIALDSMTPECREGWLRAAAAAVEYIKQCIDVGKQVQ